MVQELSARDMENRARVFVSLKTRDMQGARRALEARYADVCAEDGLLRVYDVDDSEDIVDHLMRNGHTVSEITRNRIGLEEYYVELMSKKEVR